MTYSESPVPGGSSVNKTFDNLNTNAAAANQVFNTDHIQFNDPDPAKRGKHRKSTIIASSAPVTLQNENAIFSLTGSEGDPVSNKTKLFSKRDTDTLDYPLQAIRVFGSVTVLAGTPPVLKPNSLGVQSVAATSATSYKVTFSENFADANYTIFLQATGTPAVSERDKEFFVFSYQNLSERVLDFLVLRGY